MQKGRSVKSENPSGFYKWNRSCFLIKNKDKRYKRFQEFKKKHGFSPDETWDLGWATAMFLLPRLKYFKKHACGYPASLETQEEWYDILDKIINALELYLVDEPERLPKYRKLFKKDGYSAVNTQVCKEMDEGFALLGEWFAALWW